MHGGCPAHHRSHIERRMYLYKTEPMAHQRAALNKLAYLRDGALFMEQGTGKTKIILDMAAALYEAGEIDTLIVISLNGVHEQWVDQEVPKHLPDRVLRVAHSYRAGLANRKFWDALQCTDKLVILTFNVETLSKRTVKNIERAFRVETREGKKVRQRKVLLAVDESHKIKTPSAQRTRIAWRVGGLAEYRRIGTGTEISKGLEDLYAQFRFLDPRIIGCHTFTEFKARYCEVVGEYNEIRGYKNVDELMAKIEPYVFVAEKKDCMDLPEQVFMPDRIVSLLPEQKRLIKDLRENYVTQLSSGAVVEAPLAISRLQKFQQIAAGHVSLGQGKWEPVPNGSLDAMVDIMEEVRGQFIIWAQWQPDILQLTERLRKAGLDHVTYFGGNSDAQNSRNKALFKDRQTAGFLATFGKGSAGLDFPGVDTSAYYTLTFDAVDYWQSLSRNHRKGTTAKVTYHTLVRPGSPDRKLLAALKTKQDIAKLMRNPAIFKQWLDDLVEST